MTKNEPLHPGYFLLEHLEDLGITQYRLAKTIGVPRRRINEIILGRRSVTADSAVRIGRALGTTAEFWLNLQRHYDLRIARNAVDIESIKPLVASEETHPDHAETKREHAIQTAVARVVGPDEARKLMATAAPTPEPRLTAYEASQLRRAAAQRDGR